MDEKKLAGVGITALFTAAVISWITGASGLQIAGVFAVLFVIFWAAAGDQKDKKDE